MLQMLAWSAKRWQDWFNFTDTTMCQRYTWKTGQLQSSVSYS